MDTVNKGHKILIIDDDMFILEMYALKFKEEGFNVEVAKNASEAFEKLSNKEVEPEVILLDILMEGLDGYQFLKNLKEKKIAPNSKIVILSNLGQKEEIEQGMSLGAEDYIVKAHHTPTEVVHKIRNLLN